MEGVNDLCGNKYVSGFHRWHYAVLCVYRSTGCLSFTVDEEFFYGIHEAAFSGKIEGFHICV
jgi:hypothetical protein